MATLTIRRVDEAVREKLRLRAARHGRSMEEEIRRILDEVCAAEDQADLPDNAFARMRRHFEDLEGVDLDLPPRTPGREPPDFR
jgi:plasmid stability protein